MKLLRILMIGLVSAALLFSSVGSVSAQAEEPQPQPQNPVAAFLAGVTGLTPQEISDLQQQGFGMGNISKAYYLLKNGMPGDINSILEQSTTTGWGQLFKQAGVHPGGGVGWLFKGKGGTAVEGITSGWTPPGQAKKNNVMVPPGQAKKNNVVVPPGQAKKNNAVVPPVQQKNQIRITARVTASINNL